MEDDEKDISKYVLAFFFLKNPKSVKYKKKLDKLSRFNTCEIFFSS